MRLLGASRSVAMTAGERQRAAVNYLIGKRRSRWQRRVPTFARVTYHDVYRGIDLVYHATSGQLEYDFDLAPAADPSTINLQLREAGICIWTSTVNCTSGSRTARWFRTHPASISTAAAYDTR
jgi:hypothetical protein